MKLLKSGLRGPKFNVIKIKEDWKDAIRTGVHTVNIHTRSLQLGMLNSHWSVRIFHKTKEICGYFGHYHYHINILPIIFFFLVFWGAVRLHLVGWPLTGLLYPPRMIDDVWSGRWNANWQRKPKYSEKTCPGATLSTTNPA
jgi:hypothetical protein